MNPLVGNSHQGASLSLERLSEAPFWLPLSTNHKEIYHVVYIFCMLSDGLHFEPPNCSCARFVRRFIMSLTANQREFFAKVANKNFRLACDVYHALATGKAATPEVRSQIREALRIAA